MPQSASAARAAAAGRPEIEKTKDHYWIFTMVASVSPLLSIQLTFRSPPLLPPLKLNLT